jgi:hypothetical protein
VEYHRLPATWTTQVATVVDGQTQVHVCVGTEFFHVIEIHVARSQVCALMLVAVSVCAVLYGTLHVPTHLALQYFLQCAYLQVTYALWQPTLALTGVAGSLLVYKHSVERPATAFAYAEIFGGVDPIMFEQSFVNHYQYLQEVRSPLRIFTLRFFCNYAMVILRFYAFANFSKR